MHKLWTVVLLGYMALLLVLSVAPDTGVYEDDANFVTLIPPQVQNFLHIPAYGVLALLWIVALQGWRQPSPRVFRLALLLAAGYGVGLECVQIGIPGRYPSATDALFNIIGVGLGGWWYRFIRRRGET